jgi:hypothetical protein
MSLLLIQNIIDISSNIVYNPAAKRGRATLVELNFMEGIPSSNTLTISTMNFQINLKNNNNNCKHNLIVLQISHNLIVLQISHNLSVILYFTKAH